MFCEDLRISEALKATNQKRRRVNPPYNQSTEHIES
jgi:hypothetical protein